MIQSIFCRQWERFREHLSNRQLSNLAAILEWQVNRHQIKDGGAHIVIVTPEPKAAVFVVKHRDVLYLVGGHWLRFGEPTADFLALMRRDIARINEREMS